MVNYYNFKRWIIWLSFLSALLLQIMPWPYYILILKPNLVLLILIFWVIALPYKVNVGTGFIIGILTDIINGSTLGVHALAMSVITYLTILKYQLFRNFTLHQQALVVILLSCIFEIITFWIEFLIIDICFHPKLLLRSIINGIIWPWFSLLMNKFATKYL